MLFRSLWRKELEEHEALFSKLGERLPRKMQAERERLGSNF